MVIAVISADASAEGPCCEDLVMALSPNASSMSDGLTLGFIGTGAIAEVLIDGLIDSAGHRGRILTSHRSSQRSAALNERHATVTVHSDNQQIVDESDVVFLATLVGQAEAALSKLTIDSSTVLVSLVAGLDCATLQAAVGAEDVPIHRIIPMPPNRFGLGPIPLFPPSSDLESLLAGIGTVVPVDDEATFATFVGSSALMGLFFEFLATNSRWMQRNGVDSDHASRYTSALFHGLAAEALSDPTELLGLADACLTPGGLNEQVLSATRANGLFDAIDLQLDAILERITND